MLGFEIVTGIRAVSSMWLASWIIGSTFSSKRRRSRSTNWHQDPPLYLARNLSDFVAIVYSPRYIFSIDTCKTEIWCHVFLKEYISQTFGGIWECVRQLPAGPAATRRATFYDLFSVLRQGRCWTVNRSRTQPETPIIYFYFFFFFGNITGAIRVTEWLWEHAGGQTAAYSCGGGCPLTGERRDEDKATLFDNISAPQHQRPDSNDLPSFASCVCAVVSCRHFSVF